MVLIAEPDTLANDVVERMAARFSFPGFSLRHIVAYRVHFRLFWPVVPKDWIMRDVVYTPKYTAVYIAPD